MTLNDSLLETARTAGRALIEAEHQVLTTRVDYHTAIRRLHLAGAPLREIADALGLSHQRIQQIVDGSGGSWWRRAWRTRKASRDAICTWCQRPPGEMEKLVAGPNVYICDRCVREMARAMTDAAAKGRATTGSRRCSFCGKRATATRQVAGAGAATVCRECLQLCREFMKLDV
jgi:ribosomal protein S14